MEKSGVNSKLIDRLMEDLQKIAPFLPQEPLAPDVIQQKVGSLREAVCDLWEGMEEIFDRDSGMEKLKNKLHRVVKCAAGTEVIAANASADVVAMGPWVSTTSVAFGGALIGQSLESSQR